ncbi:MAG TPA: FmdB family transcriptional regulator [Opitutaceae bacterium]|nr:FmdB family transcriptional regulator [Opitutaceae bacterium]
MPIYEYYCPDNHKIYQFYAKTFAQGQTVPPCPDNPAFRMRRILSPFTLARRARKSADARPGVEGPGPKETAPGGDAAADARMEAAMSAMEGEFANVDENDPRAMGRMMRRMTELTGEKLDDKMEEVVRKLEEGADPDGLEEELGDAFGEDAGPEAPPGENPPGAGAGPAAGSQEARPRFRLRRGPPRRDPKLYDYP